MLLVVIATVALDAPTLSCASKTAQLIVYGSLQCNQALPHRVVHGQNSSSHGKNKKTAILVAHSKISIEFAMAEQRRTSFTNVRSFSKGNHLLEHIVNMSSRPALAAE